MISVFPKAWIILPECIPMSGVKRTVEELKNHRSDWLIVSRVVVEDEVDVDGSVVAFESELDHDARGLKKDDTRPGIMEREVKGFR